ncbi:Tim44 domain-containing protein [Mangrovicella endophytica]|uniref:Tim44 domain-containing protein n=1 Tax=Mangrovicella endophytica TaxID=2066697 RepID=UPI000C9DF5EB|nr:Tim44 domain-containing protein [Mangrovicella endophytica]
MTSSLRLGTLFTCLFLAFSFVGVDFAEARRGGSFGSRGSRTFQSAPVTRTAPTQSAPLERSMTPRTGNQTGSFANRSATPQRPGFFNGFGGSLLRGLAIGGLIGLLFGGGFGGMAGLFGMILQIALIAVAAMFLMRLFRRRSAPAYAGAGQTYRDSGQDAPRGAPAGQGSFRIPSIGSGSRSNAGPAAAAAASTARPGQSDEIGITQRDLDTFERMLAEVQDAFGREDYGALRRITTPEMMSYLAEELGENATNGLRNEVSDVKLLQGDVAEAWNEDGRDYATVAMRYSSVDVMRDRATGRIAAGASAEPSETTELWTFVRRPGTAWTLSAIQEA